MITLKKVEKSDHNKVINLIKNINEKDLTYLRYDKESGTLAEEWIEQHVKEGTLILIMQAHEVVGLFEYELIKEWKLLWITSLYFKEEVRKYSFRIALSILKKLQDKYKWTISFTAMPENEKMMKIVKFLKASHVRTYDDGRIEYAIRRKS